MIVIAHAGHWALGLLEAAPLLIVAAFATCRTHAERRRRRAAGDTPELLERIGAGSAHP
jgi:hypothetical protein